MLNEASDEMVIHSILNGNRNDFRILVDRYQGSVASVVFNMLKDPVEAEEIGQDVFVKLFQNLEQFNRQSSLKTYVTRIAINLSLNRIKRNKWKWTRFTNSDDASLHLEVQSPMSYDDQQLLEQVLQRLSTEQRSVVVLRKIEGYSTEETAEILGISAGTVMSRLHRAMKNMKSMINHGK